MEKEIFEVQMPEDTWAILVFPRQNIPNSTMCFWIDLGGMFVILEIPEKPTDPAFASFVLCETIWQASRVSGELFCPEARFKSHLDLVIVFCYTGARGVLITVFKYIKETYKEHGDGFFSAAVAGRSRSNGNKKKKN